MLKKYDSFLETLWGFYDAHGRDLPWRHTDDPYKIMVSEIMLQQTQVGRVIPKYQEFLKQFPTVNVLAKAELGAVLRAWSGLGYNRRAKFLHQAAQMVVERYKGTFPESLGELVQLPGVGHNTAGAILAYAFNKPVVFIETNVRSVYIHHFFADRDDVADKELLPYIEATLDKQNPREFYWALMDYGSHLKQTTGNAAARSKHHVKQSTFVGSKRQVRGAILRALGQGARSLQQLQGQVSDERLEVVLTELCNEGLVTHQASRYSLG